MTTKMIVMLDKSLLYNTDLVLMKFDYLFVEKDALKFEFVVCWSKKTFLSTSTLQLSTHNLSPGRKTAA